MVGNKKKQVQLFVASDSNRTRKHPKTLCGECEGRGWIWVRSYEICPECYGTGDWQLPVQRVKLAASQRTHL